MQDYIKEFSLVMAVERVNAEISEIQKRGRERYEEAIARGDDAYAKICEDYAKYLKGVKETLIGLVIDTSKEK